MRDQHRTLLYILPMGTNAHDIWNFIGSAGGKTCVINQHFITYAQAKYAIVCFDFVASINAIMETMPVLKSANLHWAHLSSAKCANFSSEMKPTLMVSVELNNRFATLEHSLTSLMECIDKLAKRLDSPGPMVSQPSPGH
ncbi:hypothetical protein G9A89_011247 [Geosiphon pyriformis]|nr:hypothetical protein G9A89_011247 [Geosiphon pyriformis]